MREILFRAWDRKRKEMFPIHELEWHKISHSLTKCVGYDDWDKDGYTMHGGGIMKYANEERFILQQYTGLRDKNGKYIFEGDVLNTHYEEGEGPIKGIVFYSNGAFKVTSDWVNIKDYTVYDLLDEDLIQGNNAEVIGNLYENPELTK